MSVGKLFALAALIAIQGCTSMSISELRNEAPSKTAVANGEYTEQANCVLHKMQTSETSRFGLMPGNLSYEIVHRKTIGKVFITGSEVGATRKVPVIDIIVSAKGEDKSEIETRPGGTRNFRDVGLAVEEKTWSLINECAGEMKKVVIAAGRLS